MEARRARGKGQGSPLTAHRSPLTSHLSPSPSPYPYPYPYPSPKPYPNPTPDPNQEATSADLQGFLAKRAEAETELGPSTLAKDRVAVESKKRARLAHQKAKHLKEAAFKMAEETINQRR